MIELRYYQRAAIDSVYEFWRGKGGNALIELATGTGKSAVAGSFCKELLAGWPDMRVGVIAHVKELIAQNAQEMLRIWPGAPIGIYSAGLGRRDTRAQVLFGGIQSIHRKAEMLHGFDVLLIDEAHLIPRDSETMYGRFISDCRKQVPDMRIVGLTATPYRLGSGRLDEGEGKIFDRITYSYDIGKGVEDGYLAPLTSKRASGEVDLSGIKITAGDFAQGELERRMMRDTKIAEACAEVVAYMKQQNRRKAMVFCTGVDHAHAVRDELRKLGLRVEAVTGETPAAERDKLIANFRGGWLDCLTGVGVLTTGFNVADIDLIALMRPTLSTGLYVQMLGRGTRPVYEPGFNMDSASGRRAAIAASVKPNCLVLDYAGCGQIHGPVDDLTPPSAPGASGKRDQEKVTIKTERGKYCPECGELQAISAIECRDCGYLYPIEAKHEARADDKAAIMKAEQVPEWRAVSGMFCNRHEKAGGTPSFRVDYLCDTQRFSDWLCFEHENGAKQMAHKKWEDLRGEMPAPATIDEALDREEEIATPSEILVAKDGQFWRVVAKRFGAPPAPVADWGKEIDDEIPF